MKEDRVPDLQNKLKTMIHWFCFVMEK